MRTAAEARSSRQLGTFARSQKRLAGPPVSGQPRGEASPRRRAQLLSNSGEFCEFHFESPLPRPKGSLPRSGRAAPPREVSRVAPERRTARFAAATSFAAFHLRTSGRQNFAPRVVPGPSNLCAGSRRRDPGSRRRDPSRAAPTPRRHGHQDNILLPLDGRGGGGRGPRHRPRVGPVLAELGRVARRRPGGPDVFPTAARRRSAQALEKRLDCDLLSRAPMATVGRPKARCTPGAKLQKTEGTLCLGNARAAAGEEHCAETSDGPRDSGRSERARRTRPPR